MFQNYGFVVFEDNKTVERVLNHKGAFLLPSGHRLNVEEKKQRGESGRPGSGTRSGGRGGSSGPAGRIGAPGGFGRGGGRGGGSLGGGSSRTDNRGSGGREGGRGGFGGPRR